MRHAPKLHLGLLIAAWILGIAWGTVGMVAASAVVLLIGLVAWRADLPRPRSFRRRWHLPGRDEQSGPVPSYDAVRHAIRMGAHSGREFDFNLRHRLERVASTRLDDAHGVDLHREPERARDLLGAELWPLIDPQRPISPDRSGGGLPTDQLREIVARLERL